jgi:hypothetical protein
LLLSDDVFDHYDGTAPADVRRGDGPHISVPCFVVVVRATT